MAKNIIAQGAAIDKLRAEISDAFKACKKHEATLTKAGVQAGSINFKSDRPNTMFIYEPTNDGQRKYVHVGVDRRMQALAKERVARWKQRADLRKAVIQLKAGLSDMDWQTEQALMAAESVRVQAKSIIAKHVNEG